MKNKCSAGIVLYNPNISRLKCNIDSIIKQVERLILFDNGSINITEIEDLIKKYSYNNIKLIRSSENKGIAYALNIMVRESKIEGYNWILTLDQDSVTQENTINIFEKYINENRTAIICPYVIDKRRKNIKYQIPNEETSYIKFCITSGSLINVNICEKIGGFDEWMFIGLVDNDYCKKVDISGYKIVRVNSIVLDHELGNLTPSKFEKVYLKLESLLNIDFIGKLSYKREVDPIRLYYATRNMIYMMKKYKLYENRKDAIIELAKNCLFSIIRGKNKIILLKKIKNGIVDGSKVTVDCFIK